MNHHNFDKIYLLLRWQTQNRDKSVAARLRCSFRQTLDSHSKYPFIANFTRIQIIQIFVHSPGYSILFHFPLTVYCNFFPCPISSWPFFARCNSRTKYCNFLDVEETSFQIHKFTEHFFRCVPLSCTCEPRSLRI